MFAETIREAVRSRAQAMIDAHPALERARSGQITPAGIARYLASIHRLLTFTPPHLKRAHSRALAAGERGLAGFFEHKIEEETGHDAWAAADIERHRGAVGAQPHAAPLPAIDELITFLAELIERDPRLYLVYIFTNEYFTVLAGPVWIEALCSGCGLSADMLTAVGKHVEADREHAAQGFAQLDVYLTEPGLETPVGEVIEGTFAHFSAVLDQVCEVTAASAA